MSADDQLLPMSPTVQTGTGMVLRHIAQLVVEKKVQFLCGAGMSKASGCPLAEELSAEMLRDLLGDISDADVNKLTRQYQFEAIAGAFLDIQDPIRLKGLVRKALDRADGNVNAGHRALEYLFSQGYIDRVYTTNFDTLLETGFNERHCTVTDDNAYLVHEARAKKKIPVIHLHGTLDSHKYLIAEKDTYKLDTGLARLMMADMVTHWFIWIGYSLGDIDLRSLYLSMRELLARTEDLIKKPYVVYPLSLTDTAKTQELELATAIWRSRGANYVPMRAEEFLPKLVEEVRRTKGQALAKELAKKHGLNPESSTDLDTIWKKAKELNKTLPVDDELNALRILAQREGIEHGG